MEVRPPLALGALTITGDNGSGTLGQPSAPNSSHAQPRRRVELTQVDRQDPSLANIPPFPDLRLPVNDKQDFGYLEDKYPVREDDIEIDLEHLGEEPEDAFYVGEGREDDFLIEEEYGDEGEEVENAREILAPDNKPPKFTQDELKIIIDEVIAQFEESWWPGKGMPRDEIPDKEDLWEKAEKAGIRKKLVEQLEEEIKYFDDRLQITCKAICDTNPQTEDKVRRQCKSLEGYVELLQERHWLVELYESDEPPGESEGEEEEDEDVEVTGMEHGQVTEAMDHTQIAETGYGQITERHHTQIAERSHTQITETGYAQITLPHRGAHDTSMGSQPVERRQPRPSGVSLTEAIDLTSEPGTPNQDIQMLDGPSVLPSSPPLGSFQAPINFTQPVANIQEGTAAASISRTGSSRPHSTKKAVGNQPELASMLTVSKWDWKELIELADRKRIIMRVMLDMPADDREIIRSRMQLVRKANLLREIGECTRMLLRRESKMPGVLPRDLDKIMVSTRFFFCWWFADDYFNKAATEGQLQELVDTMRAGCEDLDIFYDWVHRILEGTFSLKALRVPLMPSQAEIIVLSDDDD